MPERGAVEEFMAELYERARQDGESPERVAERVYENVRGVSRRELLRGGGALGAGAAIGGGGGYAMSQPGAAQEDDDDGNVGTPDDPVDVYADLASIEEIYNDEEPAVDISRADWLTRTDAIVKPFLADSLDGLDVSTSGSGSTDVVFSFIELSTGSTSGSTVEVRDFVQSYGVEPTFDKPQSMSFGVELRGGETSRTNYITRGRVSNGNQGFGVKVVNNSVRAVTHDGSAENQSELLTYSGNKSLDMEAVFDGSVVTITVDGNTETLTSNTPSGSSDAREWIDFYAENSTSDDRSLRIGPPGWVVQMP